MNTAPKNKAAALKDWSREAPLHGKLTYVGPQEKPTQTVLFHRGAPSSLELFRQFQSTGVSYLNDTVMTPASFTISLEEQGRILAALAESGFEPSSSEVYWSLVLTQTDGGQRRGTEWLMNDELCKRVVHLIASALAEQNSEGLQILSEVPL